MAHVYARALALFVALRNKACLSARGGKAVGKVGRDHYAVLIILVRIGRLRGYDSRRRRLRLRVVFALLPERPREVAHGVQPAHRAFREQVGIALALGCGKLIILLVFHRYIGRAFKPLDVGIAPPDAHCAAEAYNEAEHGDERELEFCVSLSQLNHIFSDKIIYNIYSAHLCTRVLL